MGNIDYAKLFRDKRLDIAIGVGYEFAGEKPDFSNELNDIITVLLGNGFRKTAKSSSDLYYDTYYLRKRYYLTATKQLVDVDIYVYITSSKKKSPASTFASFLATKEIVIYSGHGRIGIGPDFDDEKSSKENFIVGLNTVAHANNQLKLQNSPHDKALRIKYVKGMHSRKDNDLESITKKNLFSENLYQVWFFNACSSIDYLDEIRGKWSVKDKMQKFGLVRTETGKIKSKANLVIFGTKQSVRSDATPILKQILAGKSMDDIVKTMQAYEKLFSPDNNSNNIYFSD
ncbi:hypothetical protein GCM10022289_31250 [Pedobacter jeongneungensis]|uniref:SIR2-like domain-containing protein n=1 Tax=Pedobacter jeongneungensis TaxID=947309 RepID=A0ABP8BJ34_9SPHI